MITSMLVSIVLLIVSSGYRFVENEEPVENQRKNVVVDSYNKAVNEVLTLLSLVRNGNVLAYRPITKNNTLGKEVIIDLPTYGLKDEPEFEDVPIRGKVGMILDVLDDELEIDRGEEDESIVESTVIPEVSEPRKVVKTGAWDARDLDTKEEPDDPFVNEMDRD